VSKVGRGIAKRGLGRSYVKKVATNVGLERAERVIPAGEIIWGQIQLPICDVFCEDCHN
jgi:hypothetical protein